MADSLRVRKLKARRKHVADEVRRDVRLLLRKIRHGDFDKMLPVLETYFRTLRRMEKEP